MEKEEYGKPDSSNKEDAEVKNENEAVKKDWPRRKERECNKVNRIKGKKKTEIKEEKKWPGKE